MIKVRGSVVIPVLFVVLELLPYIIRLTIQGNILTSSIPRTLH